MLALRKFIFEWWPLLTTVAWSLIMAGIVVVGLGLHGLGESVLSLAQRVTASDIHYDFLRDDLEEEKRKSERRASENFIHIQALSGRLEILEKRINELSPRSKKRKSTEEIIMREYIIVPAHPQKPAKNAKQAKSAN